MRRLGCDDVSAAGRGFEDIGGRQRRINLCASDSPMEETEKALNLLIHDLRAPLSVAQGYLRLLQQNRLEAEADRQRAITQSMDALGKITRMCDDAAAFVAE